MFPWALMVHENSWNFLGTLWADIDRDFAAEISNFEHMYCAPGQNNLQFSLNIYFVDCEPMNTV